MPLSRLRGCGLTGMAGERRGGARGRRGSGAGMPLSRLRRCGLTGRAGERWGGTWRRRESPGGEAAVAAAPLRSRDGAVRAAGPRPEAAGRAGLRPIAPTGRQDAPSWGLPKRTPWKLRRPKSADWKAAARATCLRRRNGSQAIRNSSGPEPANAAIGNSVYRVRTGSEPRLPQGSIRQTHRIRPFWAPLASVCDRPCRNL